MAKKQDVYYFNNFVACAEESCHAAHLLKDVLANFNPDDLTGRLDEMHAIETRADGRKHEAMDRLAKEFIPPIEREDIITLSQYLDDLTDKIEDVLLRIYMNHVTRVRVWIPRVRTMVLSPFWRITCRASGTQVTEAPRLSAMSRTGTRVRPFCPAGYCTRAGTSRGYRAVPSRVRLTRSVSVSAPYWPADSS